MQEPVTLLHAWIDQHRSDIVSSLQGVLRIPSVKGPPAEGAPYGPSVRQALDYTLQLCQEFGFRTRDVDGHAGHAEFGAGAEMVAAMGHLDVVPEGQGWRHEPFGAEISDGYIYARGASDDKGPTFAALFAARAVMECELPLRRRIRIIFGCDEESGFGCVKHYWDVAREERPVLAFTPDASFPLIYAEKGIANLVLERTLTENALPLRAVSASGGLRPNMVPEAAVAELRGDPGLLLSAGAVLQRFWDKNVSTSVTESGLTIAARGKSAHGARPELGDNAIVRLAKALLSLDLPADTAWLQWIPPSAHASGRGLGIEGSDDVAGPLTCNLGLLELTSPQLRLTYNIRYPVTWTKQHLLSRCEPTCTAAGWTIAELHDQHPLHVPLDEEPTRTLLRVYREETADTTSQPGTMGGGTYARATPHAVAFGAGFPAGGDGPAHEPDERISIQSLMSATKIYARALYEMAK